MNEAFFTDLHKEVEKAVVAFRKDLSKIRTGRASTALLEGIMVDYYGASTPLNQLATLSAPEPRLLVVQPYDPGAIGNIEKGILKADLGLNPANDGKLIRIPIPELTEERRKQLAKHVHKVTEHGHNEVRQIRRKGNDEVKKLEKEKKISQDEEKKGMDTVQKLH